MINLLLITPIIKKWLHFHSEFASLSFVNTGLCYIFFDRTDSLRQIFDRLSQLAIIYLKPFSMYPFVSHEQAASSLNLCSLSV